MKVRSILLASLFLGVVSATAACNTVKGAGEDIKAGGEAVAKSAEQVKDDMSKK
ncbi:MAG: entericidin A/B family lipoprotein [Hyphomonadaceae bacterium]